jgi:LemA protein
MNSLVVIVIIVVLVAGFVVLIYNGLVRRRNNVDNSWSQIDVQLKRRLDLIPNLVETVKGYVSHERTTLEAVITARNSAMAAPTTPHAQAVADNAITGALKQLFALSEAYPDLKANQGFISLQEELANTESRIAYARQFYGDSVFQYNTAIQKFPAVVIAKMFGFTAREFFEAEETARTAPQVKF